MNNKDKTIEFLRKKNEILYELTGIYLYSKADFEDIESWDDDTFFDNFIVHSLPSLSDCGICPWCYQFHIICENCSYGLRNGSCLKRDSIYKEMKVALGDHGAIIGVAEIKSLVHNYIDN